MVLIYINIKNVTKKNFMKKIKYNIPDNLEPEAKIFIKNVLCYLEENNMSQNVDIAAINMLAYNYSLFIKATHDIEIQGLTAIGSRGNLITNPLIRIANDAQVQSMKLMEKFGLTPKDRKRMNSIEDDGDIEESPLMKFIQESKEIR